MEAILLAAGEGSRLRPYTLDKPKPMVRAANKPMAQHAVEALVANGVKDITLVVGYQRAKVQSYFGDGQRFGARLKYSFQEVLTGTATALANVPAPKDAFLVLGADNVVDAALVKSAMGGDPKTPSLVIQRSEQPTRYGVVAVEGSAVTSIVEKPSEPRSDWVNTGLYRFPASFHKKVLEADLAGLHGLPDILQREVTLGTRVEAIRSDGLWADAVYPWDLLRVHGKLLRNALRPATPPGVHADREVLVDEDVSIGPGTFLGTGTCVGRNVVIHPNCVIENSVIYDDVEIGPGTILRNSIVGEGSRLGPRVTAVSGACEVRTTHAWHALDDFGAVIGEDCKIGGAATLLPGAFVGNRAKIAPAKVIGGTLDDNSIVI